MIKVGITGGIGSGKSVVSRLFNRLGAPVYDSDQRAKHLMTTNTELKRRIVEIFGTESYVGCELNRAHIAQMAFADSELLKRLNQAVHPAVAEDFRLWTEEQQIQRMPYVILESAILIESGFYRFVDRVVCVTAPIELRIQRTVERDKIEARQVRERIDNQMCNKERMGYCTHTIINDNHTLVVPQVVELDKLFRGENRGK